MKKVLILVSAVLVLLSPLAAQIKVVSPNGGETLVLGQQWPIAWTANNVKQDVRILLLKAGGAKFGVIKEPLKPGASPWGWTIGQTTDAGIAPPGQYKIRVTTVNGSNVDGSDKPFTITAAGPPPPSGPPSITVTSPNGGETWEKFSTKNITWTAVNFDGSVDLILMQNDKTIGTIASKLPAKQGFHPWPVGNLLNGKTSGLAGGEGYKVRVEKNWEGLFKRENIQFYDDSDNAFSIKLGISSHDDVSKPLITYESYGSEPKVQNCHFILHNDFDHWGNKHYDFNLWKGMPQDPALANVGFLWYRSMGSDSPIDRDYEVWKSWVKFDIEQIKRLAKGDVQEAGLYIRRIWKTKIVLDPKWDIPGLSDPCLAGVVLLDAPPPCEWGEIKPHRSSVPSPAGKAIPITNWEGDFCSVDVTEHVRQIIKGERQDHGFMLYTWEQDPVEGYGWDVHRQYVALNAGCYYVRLSIKFAYRSPLITK